MHSRKSSITLFNCNCMLVLRLFVQVFIHTYRKYILRFIICLLWLLSATAAAGQLTTVNAHWPPWRVLKDDGQLSGIDIDILQDLSTRLQLKLVTKGCGWKRCLKYMEVGESDIMTGLYRTPEREQYMKFIAPPYRVTQGTCFYVNKNNSLKINKYQDLQELTIGVVKKVSYFEQFDNDSNLNKYQVTTDEDLFRLLRGKRIDTIILACTTGDITLKQLGLAGEIKRANYIHTVIRPVYLAVSKQSPLLAREKEISQALQEMLETGKIKQIMTSYGIVAIE
jgi:polar amino acid transport system substrate-binding protein